MNETMIHYWKEILAIVLTILGIFGMVIKKQEGNMLVTRSYLKEELQAELRRSTSDITLALTTAINDSTSEVYKRMDVRCEGVQEQISEANKRLNEHIDRKVTSC